jgi:tripartite-type tricarboxylate transporter receptor subunit TctC
MGLQTGLQTGLHTLRIVAAAITATLIGLTPAAAEQYPSRAIMLVVPFPAGGPTDTLARILGERMRVSPASRS